MARSRKRTLQALGASALIAGLMISGCSAGGVSSGGGPTPENLDSSAEEFLRTRGEQLGAQSISVLAQSSPQANSIQAIAGQFTELTGIEVEFTILDEQSVENRAAVALGSSSGGYDVVQTPSGFIPSYVDRGWIEPLDDHIADTDTIIPGWDIEAYGSGTTSLLSRKGSLYGIPMFIGTQVFYYRTDIFEAAGITAPPTTYAELAEVVKKIHSSETAGIALRTAPSASQLLFVWSAWLYANGGKYYENFADGTYSGSALDSPEALESFKTFIDLVQNYAPSGATNWSVDDVTRAFMAGRAAIVQEGIVFGGTFNNPETSQVADKINTFTLPAGPAGSFVPYNTHGWSIAANSKAMDAAWLFTQWATLDTTLVSASDSDANFGSPPLAEVYESAEYQARYGFGDFVGTVQATMAIANGGGVSPFPDDPNYLPATPDWATVGQQIAEDLSKAVTGQETPETALAAAASRLK